MNLDLTPGYSKALVALNLCLCAASVTVIYLAQWDRWLFIAISFAALVGATYHIGWLMGLQPTSIRRIQFLDGTWWLTFQDGRLSKGTLVGPVVVLPWMISARFRVRGRLIDWLVTADMLTKTEHRRLRVAVRFAGCETPVQFWIDKLKNLLLSNSLYPNFLSKSFYPNFLSKSGRHQNRVRRLGR